MTRKSQTKFWRIIMSIYCNVSVKSGLNIPETNVELRKLISTQIRAYQYWKFYMVKENGVKNIGKIFVFFQKQ